MKPLSFNLKDAKKIAGDKESSTFHLRDGHQIKVMHSLLPAMQRKALERLPLHNSDPLKLAQGGMIKKYAEGTTDGPVKGDYQAPVMANNNSPIDYGALPTNDTTDSTPRIQLDPNRATTVQPEQSSPDMAPSPVVAGPDTSQATAAAPSSTGLADQGYNTGLKGLSETADVEGKEAANRLEVEKSDLQAKQDLMGDTQQNYKDFSVHHQQLMQDYLNAKIDPNHYMENRSVPQQIAQGIGMLLGGFSTHGNPAVDFINKQIDRDIEAQKSRQDQQKTLLGANQDLYHDQVLGTNATRVDLAGIYANQIQQAADKLGTPAAKARADQAKAVLMLQYAPIQQQSALRATVLKSAENGGQGLDPIDLSHAGLMTPEQAQKEKASIDKQKTSIDYMKNLYSQAASNQTLGNRVGSPIQSASEVDRINGAIANTVLENDASKRLTPESVKVELQPYYVNLRDSKDEVNKKLQGALNLIKSKAEPTPVTQKYAPRALPNYDIPVVKNFSGVPYQQVPGGWKKI